MLQKYPKVSDEDARKWDRFKFSMICLWLSPYFVMLGADALGWHWSYWKSFFVEAMVMFPLECVIGSAQRWWIDNS